MKKIYVILTHTGTALSRLIKVYTRDEFSHVSIALDSELQEMYSFGRLNAYNPFFGGFVHEHIDSGTFKRFKNTNSCVYEVTVTDEEYENIKNTIKYFNDHKNEYKFNFVGLFAVSLNKRITFNNRYYCAEFVKYALDKSGYELKLPEIIKPEDFKDIEEAHVVYRGLLRDYRYLDNLVKQVG